MTQEQYQCKSYVDDNGILKDCTCGKCHTPDTEWKNSNKGKLWSTAVEKCFQAPFVEVAIQHLLMRIDEKHQQELASRDTYWKKRVRKSVGDYANKKFLEGTIVDPLELYEAMTNEDNLK